MTYVTVIVVACLFFAVVTVWHRRYGGYLPEPYRSRPCQGFAWRRAFPASSKDEIKDFLRLFGEHSPIERLKNFKLPLKTMSWLSIAQSIRASAVSTGVSLRCSRQALRRHTRSISLKSGAKRRPLAHSSRHAKPPPAHMVNCTDFILSTKCYYLYI